MITLSGLSKSHGARVLFRDVSLQLVSGRRIALVGGNGVGKTTLLEMVVGLQDPDDGEVSRARDTTVGYLPQEIAAAGDGTVLDEVMRGADVIAALEARMRELEHGIADTSTPHEGPAYEALLAEYGDVQHRFETMGGYHVESEAQRLLAGLGFSAEDGQRPVDELSGGWMMRVGLARLLLTRPSVLVLDEPTNHLDIDTINWLEGTLGAYDGALLFVSHDRDFIDNVAERIVELTAQSANEYIVSRAAAASHGAFADFVAQRTLRHEQLQSAAANQQREIEQTERFIERFRAKATKAKQVQSRVKALERVERIEVPDDSATSARFQFPEPRRSGRVVAELKGVTKAYGDNVVHQKVHLTVERGQRVALIGPNGAGKTTLLRMLVGTEQPDTGAVELGHNVDVAYFAQHQVEALDLSRTVIEEFSTALGEAHRGRNIRTILGSFGFPGEAAERRVQVLSGGERTRLALAKVMANPVNLLCLDEPTNHLDIPSRDVLEDALEAYTGTVVLVTHDRHVIRSVADTIVEVRDGRVALHPGDYEHYLWRAGRGPNPDRPAAANGNGSGNATGRGNGQGNGQGNGRAAAKAPESAGDREARKRRDAERRNTLHRETRDLRKKVSRIERDLEKAEAEVAELTRIMADPAVYDDPERVKSLVADHSAAKDTAATLMAQWEKAQHTLERTEKRVAADLG